MDLLAKLKRPERDIFAVASPPPFASAYCHHIALLIGTSASPARLKLKVMRQRIETERAMGVIENITLLRKLKKFFDPQNA